MQTAPVGISGVLGSITHGWHYWRAGQKHRWLRGWAGPAAFSLWVKGSSLVHIEDQGWLGDVGLLKWSQESACQCALYFTLQEVDASVVREVCSKYFYDQCPAVAGLGE